MANAAWSHEVTHRIEDASSAGSPGMARACSRIPRASAYANASSSFSRVRRSSRTFSSQKGEQKTARYSNKYRAETAFMVMVIQ
eukprot:scaffold143160_cov34-Tisochrysis_lutea.AAC.8